MEITDQDVANHPEDEPVDVGHGPGFDRPDELPDGDFHSYTDRTVEKDDNE